ncbi:secreted protein containing DUF1080 [Rhodopirellula maiorica SM1]|uniref:Secreted protein containing DUF1080 n=1 Tax=Rhodopirellula maiorica SM1 TaxID=1265738 RepID=M5RJG9_9BACT|nr:DUF1080 domain-containing protein [Rhodopirellula maiorica]EMI19445.1 secreted protein containing DUF1080 [Rhodopirellula maiorica SM1]
MKRSIITIALCLFAAPLLPAEDHAAADSTGDVVLFDGKTLKGWHTKPNEFASHWTASDGMIIGDNPDKKGSVLWTDDDFADFELVVEFKTDSPDYDSGVFLHGDSHQVQIGISRSLKVDLTACIYAPVDKQGSYPAKSDKVKTVHKPGQWNTLRMVVNGKRIQTFLNDVPFVAYNAIRFPEKGKIGLQLHGGVHQKMLFRNFKFNPVK